jgi:tRNA 2-thiouridine synthesizing protein A
MEESGLPICCTIDHNTRFARTKPAADLGLIGGRKALSRILEGIPDMAEFDMELDASGLNCPLPILRAKKALTELSDGQVLRIIATDPGSMKDFEAFAKQTGHALESSQEEAGKFYFMLRKS